MTTMRQARARYFADNKFGDDGGYGSKWVEIKIGPLPLPFPNAPARVKAVRFHDLHHLVTDYRTDFIGELEISGWEIGAGCGRYPAAWFINLTGMAAGLFLAPRKVFRAFRRGVASQSLYAHDFEPLLERTVDDVKREVGTDAPVPPPGVKNTLLFALASVVGLKLLVVSALIAVTPVTVVVWALTYRAWRKSQAEELAERARGPALP